MIHPPATFLSPLFLRAPLVFAWGLIEPPVATAALIQVLTVNTCREGDASPVSSEVGNRSLFVAIAYHRATLIQVRFVGTCRPAVVPARQPGTGALPQLKVQATVQTVPSVTSGKCPFGNAGYLLVGRVRAAGGLVPPESRRGAPSDHPPTPLSSSA